MAAKVIFQGFLESIHPGKMVVISIMMYCKFTRLWVLPFTFIVRPFLLINIAFSFAFAAGASAYQKVYVPKVTESEAMSVQNIYKTLLASSGAAYLENEKTFLASGNEAVKFLQANYTVADPLDPVMRRVLLEWLEGSPQEGDAASNYLDKLPEAIKKTPLTAPSPSGAAHYLKLNFQKKAAGILALRLAKQTPMPQWRLMATLLYLEHCAVYELNPALIRFINTTENNEWQREALNVLLSTKDPKLKEKIQAEAVWLESQNDSLNYALAAFLVSP